MIKVMALMKRKDGMGFEDFRKWILEDHVAFARNLPGLRKYTSNVLRAENADAPFDGVSEMYFDDETGEVAVLKMTNAYEIGRAVNPALAHQQIVGGAWMGISHALYETTEPYYPDRSHGPLGFSEYLMPGPGDLAEMDSVIIERPASNGPYGAKGIGEMTANSPIPAIANAIFDACGVRVTSMPITPEKILRGLDALRGQTN